MDRLKSRKFWMTVVTALLTVANNGLGLGLPEEAIMTLAGTVAAYVLGQSLVDAKAASRADQGE